eukprot:TRINITY_DN5606_c0_g2_i1.p1 TRINITY_DN5606_c0_g2~~TRINITY_DN5606_c0_g2_i1.p1  ORF type:complete len:253 (+),score=35.99 TRINITY_DN5606_c0_g2_i1:451-1209(+)
MTNAGFGGTMRATRLDGTIAREAKRLKYADHLGTDRNTGNYVVVTGVRDRNRPYVHLQDANFRNIQARVVIPVQPGFVVVRPDGRLFVLGSLGDVFSVDPVSGAATPLDVDDTNHAGFRAWVDAAADERDCLVIARYHKIITFDSEGREVAALPIDCEQPDCLSQASETATALTSTFRTQTFATSRLALSFQSSLDLLLSDRTVVCSSSGRSATSFPLIPSRVPRLLWTSTTQTTLVFGPGWTPLPTSATAW